MYMRKKSNIIKKRLCSVLSISLIIMIVNQSFNLMSINNEDTEPESTYIETIDYDDDKYSYKYVNILHDFDLSKQQRKLTLYSKRSLGQSLFDDDVYVATKNINKYSLTDDEVYMLAALLYLEGRGESIECQEAICSVVLNRMSLWEMSLYDVIYQANPDPQFSTAYLVSSTVPEQEQIDVVNSVISNGVSIPEYVCYFRASYYHDWYGMNDYTDLDNTYFSYSDIDYAKFA